MKPLTSFWIVLERLIGGATVRSEWFRLLKDDTVCCEPWLQVQPQLIQSYPRAGQKPLRVVCHGPEDFVGIDEDGERKPLKRQDLVVYGVACHRLVEALATLFGSAVDGTLLTDYPRLWRVGRYMPTAGYAFPVYFHIPWSRFDLHGAVVGALLDSDGPFIFCAPTNGFLQQPTQTLLTERQALFLPLADAVCLQPPTAFAWDELGERWLREFRERVLPHSEGTPDFFPIPAICTWADLRLQFVNGETLAVEAGGLRRLYNFTQLGLVDRRSSKPNQQWQLLRDFADGKGFCKSRRGRIADAWTKRRELLTADLKRFFRLTGEPIISSQGGWQTVFTIQPDSPASLQPDEE